MKQKEKTNKAIIYCRVSSQRQVQEGDGLNSQETRCKAYAKEKGYKVYKVFKDKGVSGGLTPDQRQAFMEMLAYLDTQKDSFTIIVDDISRLTRSHEATVEIMVKLNARNAVLASPSHIFGDTASEKFLTDIMVSVASFQRESNKEQVCNRMLSRLQNGYWSFRHSPGYNYVKDTKGGKIMVLDGDKAPLIKEALQGFASGRFATQRDVVKFLERNNYNGVGKKVSPSTVKTMLTRIIYTGYIEYPKWDIPLTKGNHPAIISMETYTKNQERLGLKSRVEYRRDVNEDFPLRGFVLCAECNELMTASWSTGRNKKHPYYHCKNRSCALHGKSIKRDNVENDFLSLIKTMTPSPTIVSLAEDIIKDVWKTKKGEHTRLTVDKDREVKALDEQIDGFMARLLETDNKTMVKRYESHIEQLEKKRELLALRNQHINKIDTSYEGALGTVMDFIGNPCNLWLNGDLEEKQLVLKLAFAKKVPYDKNNGFGTASMTLPFTVLGDVGSQKSRMVEEAGFEPT